MKAFVSSLLVLAFITAMSAALLDKVDRSAQEVYLSTTGNVRPPVANADD